MVNHEKIERVEVSTDARMSVAELRAWINSGWTCERAGRTYVFTRPVRSDNACD